MRTPLSAIESLVDAIPSALAFDLQREISGYLDKCGLYYRIFARCKSGFSTSAKMASKEYEKSGRKMQDLFGVRIALYFKDDIDICVSIIEQNLHILEKVQDVVRDDEFRPVRLNLVCDLPEQISNMLDSQIWNYPVDKTFEIQIRTIFSEGWHEVDHDLRYKNKQDWDGFADLSRSFNGILAVLETCDWGILKIVDNLSYQKYKERDWESMLRSHFRLHLDNCKLDSKIKNLLDTNASLAKRFFRTNRRDLLLFLSNKSVQRFPKNINNIVYITNALTIQDERLMEITPEILRKQVENYHKSR